MGKKSKRQAGATHSSSPASRDLQINNKAVIKVVEELLARTQILKNTTLSFLWSEYDTLNVFTKVLVEKQGSSPFVLPDRTEAIPALEEWLKVNGAEYDPVEIVELPDVGFAMRAKTNIKLEDKVIIVPRKVMMTSETALQGPLGGLISKDHMLQMMPNVALALHLLNERYDPNSFWKPYINSLPHTFTSPSYFSRVELEMLQTSPCLSKAILQVRNCVKLYSHLHRLIRAYSDPSLHLYNAGFYFQDFIWAVSCVMSRQNEIPLHVDGKGNVLALIPLWDFCNHTEGYMNTFYNLETQACDCYALKDTAAGEEFRIFYGPRPNSEFLVHQGFVYMGNQADSLQLKLGLSSSDPVKNLKKELLDRLEIPTNGQFSIHPVECPFSPQLIAFTRIFTANQEELESLAALTQKELSDTVLRGKWRGDEKVLDFLEKRCHLLLQSYKTSYEEDVGLLEQAHPLSQCAREVIKMRLCEKSMLVSACRYSQAIQQKMDAILNQQDLQGLSYAELLKRMEEGRMKGDKDSFDRERMSDVNRETSEASLATGNSADAKEDISQVVMASSPHSMSVPSTECTGTVDTDTESDSNAEQTGHSRDVQTADLAHSVDSCLSAHPTTVPQQESTTDLHDTSGGQSSDKVTISQEVRDECGSLGLEELVVTNKSV